MASMTRFTAVNEDSEANGQDENPPQLFAGQKFWFSARAPMRTHFIELARSHGATVVPLDKHADVRIVDHLRPNPPPDSHSYQYIEMSIRNAKLENLADHLVNGSSESEAPTPRVVVGPKGSRNAFTEEDDQYLWNRIKPFEQRGGPVKGNEVYKLIAKIRPNHTYQSWRDRYLKHVRYQKRQITENFDYVPPGPHAAVQQSTLREERLSPRSSQTTTSATQIGHQAKKRRLDDSSSPQTDRTSQRAEGDRAQFRPSQSSSTTKVQTNQEQSVRRANSLTPKRDYARPVLQNSDNAWGSSHTFPSTSRNLPSNRGHDSPDEIGTFRKGRPPKSTSSSRPLENTAGAIDSVLVDKAISYVLNKSPEEVEGIWDGLDKATIKRMKRDLKSKLQEVDLPEYCERNDLPLADVVPLLKQYISLPPRATPNEAEDDYSDVQSSPGTITCANCFHADTNGNWRRNKEGMPICYECREILRVQEKDMASFPMNLSSVDGVADSRGKSRLVIQSSPKHQQSHDHDTRQDDNVTPNSVHRGVQTSPILPHMEFRKPIEKADVVERSSPVLARQPEPNEARKRQVDQSLQSMAEEENLFTDRSPTQLSSVGSQNVETGLNRSSHVSSRNPRQSSQHEVQETENHRSPSLGTNRKRRNVLINEPLSLEVLSTPENSQAVNGFFALLEEDIQQSSPTPANRPHSKRSRRALSNSSITVPQHDHSQQRSQKAEQRSQDTWAESSSTTHLIKEADPKISRSSQIRISPNSDADSESVSQSQQFETAPEVTQLFETAPDRIVKSQQRSQIQSQRVNGQTESSINSQLEFALPEPDGGWDDLELPLPETEEDTEEEDTVVLDMAHITSPQAKIRNEHVEKASDSPPSAPSPGKTKIDVWIAHQTSIYPTISNLESILYTVIQATSFDFRLASKVVESMIHDDFQHRSLEGKDVVCEVSVELPSNVRGCWTMEDDDSLMGNDSREMDRVQRKHGSSLLNQRFEFLEEWSRA